MLFKDKLIFKRPGALGYGLHQDYIAWKSFPESFVTVIVAIDPATEEKEPGGIPGIAAVSVRVAMVGQLLGPVAVFMGPKFAPCS